MRLPLGGLLVLGAEAAAAPVPITYSAPPECPAQASVEAAIAAKLAQGAAPGRVAITIQGDDIVGYHGALVVGSGEGGARRDVQGATCDETVAALVLVAAIAIEASAAPRAAPPARPAPPPAPPPVPPPPRPSHPARVRLSAGAGFARYSGMTPSALYVVPLHVAARRKSFELRASFDATRRDDLATSTFRWTAGRIDACYDVLATARFAIAPCGGLQVGALTSKGRMVDAIDGDTRPWLAPALTARASVRLGPAAFAVEALAAAPLVRDRYYIAPSTTIHQVPWIAFGVGAGVAVQLW